MRAYARKAGDLEFAWWAAELKLDAERKGGRLLTGMERAQGTRTDLTSGQAVEKLEYQEGVKICGGYKNAERWQLSGTVSDDDYDAWLDSLKGEAFPTSAGLRNFAKRQAAEQENGPWRTDAVSDLAALADSGEQFAAIYADPP